MIVRFVIAVLRLLARRGSEFEELSVPTERYTAW